MDVTLKITPPDNKSFIRVPIILEEGTKELRIHFVYYPLISEDASGNLVQVQKKIKDYYEKLPSDFRCPEEVEAEWFRHSKHPDQFVPLKNHLNFSLYDPVGSFRGRWDSPQFYDQWVTIGPQSSRGFLKGAIAPGEWVLEIEAHGIFSSEVTAKLQIEVVRYQSRVWFRGEMHTHTNHSDGTMSLEDLLSVAHRSGLDFVVLTDHNTMSALKQPINCQSVTLIPGLELSTYYGHAVLAGIDSYVDWRTHSSADSLERVFDAKDSRNGLFVIAHPSAIGDPLCCGCEWQYTNVEYSRVDAIEIWAGSWRKNAMFNWRSLHWWDELLNMGYKITGVAARDVHRENQFDLVDSADTVVKSWDRQRGNLLRAISQGKVGVTSSGIIDVIIVDQDNQKYGMGECVPSSARDTFCCRVTIEGAVSSGILELVCDGQVRMRKAISEGDGSYEFEVERPNRFCRVQLLEDTEVRTPMMFSNPVYFEGR